MGFFFGTQITFCQGIHPGASLLHPARQSSAQEKADGTKQKHYPRCADQEYNLDFPQSIGDVIFPFRRKSYRSDPSVIHNRDIITIISISIYHYIFIIITIRPTA